MMDQGTVRGKFFAFEGIDGSGKSTQAALLADRLRETGVRCYGTMEPTGGPVGTLTRQFPSGRMKADNRVIASLFAADRLDHLLNEVNGIKAKIEDGIAVVTDRYYFSSYAYHSVDVPMDWVITLNEQSSQILRPDLTVFIDVDPDVALERIAKNRFHQELFETKSRLVKVRENYMRAFEKLKGVEKVAVVDGNQGQEAVAEEIWKIVKEQG